MRVFDLMNMQGLNAVRVEEVIICLYKWLNRNTAIDEAIYKDCNVEEEIVRSLDIERVRAALKALTPEERDIIMNFYFSENPLSGEALAEKFATTKSSIYRRRDHALRKLKSILGFLFLTAIRRCTKIAKVVVYQRKNLEKRGLFCYN